MGDSNEINDINDRRPRNRRRDDRRHAQQAAAQPAEQRAQHTKRAPKQSRYRDRAHAQSSVATGVAVERPFTCGHCGRHVPLLPSGGRHRNHCPYCLYSRHVDELRSGDRANPCGGLMQPIGAFQRPNGEHVIVHRCLGCGFERFNRIAADDDFDLVLALPVVPPRAAPPRDPQG